jgi:hypothetical protein
MVERYSLSISAAKKAWTISAISQICVPSYIWKKWYNDYTKNKEYNIFTMCISWKINNSNGPKSTEVNLCIHQCKWHTLDGLLRKGGGLEGWCTNEHSVYMKRDESGTKDWTVELDKRGDGVRPYRRRWPSQKSIPFPLVIDLEFPEWILALSSAFHILPNEVPSLQSSTAPPLSLTQSISLCSCGFCRHLLAYCLDPRLAPKLL